MKIKCPHGWKHIGKIGSLTWEDPTVNIYEGICDSPDLCGITVCQYYDTSQEATRRFQKAQANEHTLEGLMEKLKRSQAH